MRFIEKNLLLGSSGRVNVTPDFFVTRASIGHLYMIMDAITLLESYSDRMDDDDEIDFYLVFEIRMSDTL